MTGGEVPRMPSIKLKLSLGSGASQAQAGPSTPVASASGSKPSAKRAQKVQSAGKPSKKGKEKASSVDDVPEPPKSGVILRLSAQSAQVTPNGTPSDKVVKPQKLSAKPKKLKQVSNDNQNTEDPAEPDPSEKENGSDPPLEHVESPFALPLTGPSTPSEPQSASATPATPFTPLSMPSTASTPRTRDGRGGKTLSRHGKTLGRPRGSKTHRGRFVPRAVPLPALAHDRRPSAIPPRLLSATPTTPQRAPSVLPVAPSPSPVPPAIENGEPIVKTEDDVDPISLDMSPVAMDTSTPRADGDVDDDMIGRGTTPNDKGPTTVLVKKKPLRELINRVIEQLLKKDEYDLFGEPVDLEVYPDYLEIIGGEDKAMDLGTMQAKVDDDEYEDFDQFHTDLQTLVTAAKTFNPKGSIPHISAQKILVLGEKQIEKSKPLVATPTQTPEPGMGVGMHWREGDGTAPYGYDYVEDLDPRLYIPSEMLLFPPNSLHALAVGWNLTGGRRTYAKRQIRGRERFYGKWRHWDLDGTRDLAELEDPAELFEAQQTNRGVREIIDWKQMMQDGPWWEFEYGGSNGQPPIAFTPYPRPEPPKRRQMGPFEFGAYPDLEGEATANATRNGVSVPDVLAEHLRPHKPKPRPSQIPTSSFSNIYEDGTHPPSEWLRDVLVGDTMGEAYMRSVQNFIKGAMDSKASTDVSAAEESGRIQLESYVSDKWHNGVMSPEASSMVQSTMSDMRSLVKDLARKTDRSDYQRKFLELAQICYARQAMRWLTRTDNPLNMAVLLEGPSDFNHVGQGAKFGIAHALEWTSKEMARLAPNASGQISWLDKWRAAARSGTVGKRKWMSDHETSKKRKINGDTSQIDSAASSPLTEEPSSSEEVAREEALTKLRLELAALCKYYPLAALKKISKAQAERLLPPSVRGLMTKPA